MRHVTGSFTTPKQVLHYAAYPCTRVTGLNNTYAKTTQTVKGYTKTLTLDLSIPDGQQALYAVFTGSGQGGYYTSSSGKKRYYDADWFWDEAL